MRTTLSIDDDTFHLVKRYAASRSLALGKAVSELVRRALTAPRPTRSVNGLQLLELTQQQSPRRASSFLVHGYPLSESRRTASETINRTSSSHGCISTWSRDAQERSIGNDGPGH